MFGFTRKKLELPTPEEALPGRATPIPTASNHFVNGNPLKGPYPEGAEPSSILCSVVLQGIDFNFVFIFFIVMVNGWRLLGISGEESC